MTTNFHFAILSILAERCLSLVESAGLENRCCASNRGFESHSLRHMNRVLRYELFYWTVHKAVPFLFKSPLSNAFFGMFIILLSRLIYCKNPKFSLQNEKISTSEHHCLIQLFKSSLKIRLFIGIWCLITQCDMWTLLIISIHILFKTLRKFSY